MKFRKIMSALLAGAMVLSMSVTAMATTLSDLTEGAEMEVTGTTHGAKIELTVPTSAAIIVNPYEMKLKIKDGAIDETNGTDSTAQVISPIYFLENNSTLDIKVKMSVTGTTEGEAKLVATEANATTGDDKNAYIFLAYEGVTSKAATSVADANKIVLGTTAATGELTLKATDGDTGTAKDVMAFNFQGKANKKSKDPWSDEDTIGATVAFTFEVDNGTTSGGDSGTP